MTSPAKSPPACKECGALLIPSVADIATKLKVDEEMAKELREALIEDLCAKLSDLP